MCLSACPHVRLCTMYMQCPQRPEECVRPPKRQPWARKWCWEPNLVLWKAVIALSCRAISLSLNFCMPQLTVILISFHLLMNIKLIPALWAGGIRACIQAEDAVSYPTGGARCRADDWDQHGAALQSEFWGDWVSWSFLSPLAMEYRNNNSQIMWAAGHGASGWTHTETNGKDDVAKKSASRD